MRRVGKTTLARSLPDVRYVSAPAKASGIFTVERFEEIMRKHGGVPLTVAERKKYAKFLKR